MDSSGKDLLNSRSGPARYLCRNHLADKFRKKFLVPYFEKAVLPGKTTIR